jgi:THAP4-like, heme-binding beta-barrel domain
MDPIGGLPAELAHLRWLIGRWGGIGESAYPTGQPYRYEQIVEFASDGRPFLEYRSISWVVDSDNNRTELADTESGYWRPRPDNGVELLLAHPSGRVEVWLGRVEVTSIEDARVTGAKMELTTDAVVRTETGDDVSSGQRLYGLVGGRLLSTYDMAAHGHPMANNLAIAMEPLASED